MEDQKDNLKLSGFKYCKYDLIYPKIYYQFIKEQFIFDIYQTNLLKKNDLVLDLGANIGLFTVIASRKIGEGGKVVAIEPNTDDYDILKLNLQRNDCQNVIPINLGVGKRIEEKEITFWGRTFGCKLNTLGNILHDLKLYDKINFIKMDIEGYEADVIGSSIEIFEKADVISLECHASKVEIDQLLLPFGFSFRPTTTGYIYKKMLRNLFYHPRHFFKASIDTIAKNPGLMYKIFTGYDLNNDHKDNINKDNLRTAVGSYIRIT